MLTAAFGLTSLAVLLGGWLLAARRGAIQIAHGLLGATGALVAFWAWTRGRIGGAFGTDAAWLLLVGLLAGVILASFALRRRRPADAIVVLHVALAGIGYLLLAGFALT